MLKIKDNVNLKELEKFEFKERKEDYSKTCHNFWDEIIIEKENRIISELEPDIINMDEVYDTIYDLIQAGLVEKV